MSPGDALLQVVELEKTFELGRGFSGFEPRRSVAAVAGVSFEVSPSETFAIAGESGSGKSTLARLIARLLSPTSGRIIFEGRDITTLGRRELMPIRRRLQIALQDPSAALDPRMTIDRILEEPLIIHGLSPGREKARVQQLLEEVRLSPAHASRYPHELSGGERQRVGIARALAVAPALLILDEPVSALDLFAQAEVLELLAELRAKAGLTYILISHDLRVVRHFASRVAVMEKGRFVEVAPTAALFRAPAHPYTRALLAAAPVMSACSRAYQGVAGSDFEMK